MGIETGLVSDNKGNALQIPREGASRDIGFGIRPNHSEPFSGIKAIRLCPTVDCRYAVGVGAVAQTSSPRLPADCIWAVEVEDGERVSVRPDDGKTGGKLNVVDLV